MALELVTGKAGQAHITSAQLGAGYAGIVGSGQYVMQTGSRLAATIQDANTVRIADGDAWMNGRHVTIPYGSYVDLPISSGAQGKNRNDLVVVRYARNASTGVETASLVVVEGEAVDGTASDPQINEGTVMDGSLTVDMPLWRVPISGITPGSPTRMSEAIAPLVDVQELASSNESDIDRLDGLIAEILSGADADQASFTASNWVENTTNITCLLGIVNVSMAGKIGPAIPAWTNAYAIGTLSKRPSSTTNLSGLAQVSGSFIPVIVQVGSDGTLAIRTSADSIPAATWVWISGSFPAA